MIECIVFNSGIYRFLQLGKFTGLKPTCVLGGDKYVLILFSLCTNTLCSYIRCFDSEKTRYIFPTTMGSMNAHRELVGLSTSLKVKSH